MVCRIFRELCSKIFIKKIETMKKWIAIAIVVGTLCGCGNSSPEKPDLRSVVLTQPLLLGTTHAINYSGIIREAHAISLGFKAAGQIKRIYVREGDYVRQGTLLAELDDADYRLGVEALQIQYNQLKKEVERTRLLFNQKSISANDYEKAVAGMRQLGVQLQVNKNKLAYTRLYAPTNGYVQSVNFSPAEMVDAGTALFTLLDVSHMEVVADIPVDEYRKRNLFTRFYCKVAGLEKVFPMKMLSFTPKADGNQLYQLRLAFTGSPDKRLTAGMNATIGIVMADRSAVTRWAIPLCAVFRDDESHRSCVWVYGADSTVSKRPVVLGGTDAEGRAVVVDGLTGKERIVRAGVHVLQEGERVRVVPPTSETNVGGLM